MPSRAPSPSSRLVPTPTRPSGSAAGRRASHGSRRTRPAPCWPRMARPAGPADSARVLPNCDGADAPDRPHALARSDSPARHGRGHATRPGQAMTHGRHPTAGKDRPDGTLTASPSRRRRLTRRDMRCLPWLIGQPDRPGPMVQIWHWCAAINVGSAARGTRGADQGEHELVGPLRGPYDQAFVEFRADQASLCACKLWNSGHCRARGGCCAAPPRWAIWLGRARRQLGPDPHTDRLEPYTHVVLSISWHSGEAQNAQGDDTATPRGPDDVRV